MWVGMVKSQRGMGSGRVQGPAWPRGPACILHTVADLGVAGSFCLPGMVVGRVSITTFQ